MSCTARETARIQITLSLNSSFSVMTSRETRFWIVLGGLVAALCLGLRVWGYWSVYGGGQQAWRRTVIQNTQPSGVLEICWSDLGVADPSFQAFHAHPKTKEADWSPREDGKGLTPLKSESLKFCRSISAGSEAVLRTLPDHVFGVYTEADGSGGPSAPAVSGGVDESAHDGQDDPVMELKDHLLITEHKIVYRIPEDCQSSLGPYRAPWFRWRDFLVTGITRNPIVVWIGRNRESVVSGLLFLLITQNLLAAFVFRPSSSPSAPKSEETSPQRQKNDRLRLTSHQFAKTVAVVGMIADHVGRVFLRDHRHWLTFPAQAALAHWFYYLSGSGAASFGFREFLPTSASDGEGGKGQEPTEEEEEEEKGRRRGGGDRGIRGSRAFRTATLRTVQIALSFLVLQNVLRPKDSYLGTTTLLGLTLLRTVLMSSERVWKWCFWLCTGVDPDTAEDSKLTVSPRHILVTGVLAGGLTLLDPLLGYEGVRLAYGSRALLHGMAGFAVELGHQLRSQGGIPLSKAPEKKKKKKTSVVKGMDKQTPKNSGGTGVSVRRFSVSGTPGYETIVWLWLLSATGLSLYLNFQNVVRPNLRRPLRYTVGKYMILGGAVLNLVLMKRYRFVPELWSIPDRPQPRKKGGKSVRRTDGNAGKGIGSALRRWSIRCAQFLARQSFGVYVGHVLLFWGYEYYLGMTTGE